jgi:hypothetical protein
MQVSGFHRDPQRISAATRPDIELQPYPCLASSTKTLASREAVI